MIEDLIIESIKIYGIDVYYIPQTVQNLDKLIGEDPTAKFDRAALIEVYVKDAQGFRGDGAFLSKFGLELRYQMTFTFSQRRFEEIRHPSILRENGYDLQLESVDELNPMETNAYELEDGNANGFQIEWARPRQGDLLYFPMVQKWYEIKYVKSDEVNFYQLGRLQMWEIDTEQYEYTGNKFETGVPEIDSINAFDISTLNHLFMLEDDTTMLTEDDEPYVDEDFVLEDVEPFADNTELQTDASSVVDWSQFSPLVRRDSEGQW